MKVLLLVCLATLSSNFLFSQNIELKYKVAKMLIVGFNGTSFVEDSQVVEDIKVHKVGGIILFERNITPVERGKNSIEILSNMCKEFQELRPEKLIVSIDQEGGRVTRLKKKYGFPAFEDVSAESLGMKDNLDTTRHWAELTADWLVKLHINTNFTPVCDVNVNLDCPVIAKYGRAYSADENRVTAHARAVLAGCASRGICTSVKHFPGHGSSTVDSHAGFTDVSNTWQERELTPFRELVKDENLGMVMVGHVFNRKFDSAFPASLSYSTITTLLRGELGWDRVVITDDMLMKAIASNYTFEKSVELAINAGCDIFIYSGNIKGVSTPIAELFIETVCRLVEEGKVCEKTIDRANKRIDKMVSKL